MDISPTTNTEHMRDDEAAAIGRELGQGDADHQRPSRTDDQIIEWLHEMATDEEVGGWAEAAAVKAYREAYAAGPSPVL